MKKIPKLPPKLARTLALNSQLLDGQTKLPKGREGVAQTIEKLGYIQIDTINVVERAHHQALWARRRDYRQETLHDLQAKDRRVFEYWAHAMAYVPMSDYRYYLPRMRNFQTPQSELKGGFSKWIMQLREKCGHLLEPVLERIREEGPLGAKDFEPPPGKKAGTWWDWKPAKFALELLFWRGDLMIAERRKFQKIYDLTERVLPKSADTRYPTDDELGLFFVRRALSAFGLAREKEIHTFLQPEASRDSLWAAASKDTISKALNDLVDNGEVVRVEIAERDGVEYFAFPDTLEKTTKLKKSTSRVFLLSPFDNLIIQRQRTKNLFDFDYTLECYVPAAKRKYGYFVFPILWGESLVGRLDPKADRKNKTLIIRNLGFEKHFTGFDDFLPAFVESLVDFACFNNCKKIEFEKVSPVKIKAELKRLLKNTVLKGRAG